MLGLILRMCRARVEIRLKPMPDGFGFIYGEAVDARGETRRINIMPPLTHWRGDIKLDKSGPHPTQWVLYVDGDEIGRATSRGEIHTALERFLETPSS
jgi:hypothetical protein